MCFGVRELLTNPATNQLYKEGELMKRPLLAKTLEIIADEGPDAFYNGSLSTNITLDIQEAGKADFLRMSLSVSEPPSICPSLSLSLSLSLSERNN